MPRKRQYGKCGGRPSKFSSVIARKICRFVSQGCSRDAAAFLCGISPSTLYEWQREFPQFSEGLRRADARFEAACIASIRKAGRKSRNWTANAWLLERKFPDRYGKPDRHLIRSDEQPVALPDAYKEAISRALGFTGVLTPLRAEEITGHRQLPSANDGDHRADPVDLEVLPP